MAYMPEVSLIKSLEKVRAATFIHIASHLDEGGADCNPKCSLGLKQQATENALMAAIFESSYADVRRLFSEREAA